MRRDDEVKSADCEEQRRPRLPSSDLGRSRKLMQSKRLLTLPAAPRHFGLLLLGILCIVEGGALLASPGRSSSMMPSSLVAQKRAFRNGLAASRVQFFAALPAPAARRTSR